MVGSTLPPRVTYAGSGLTFRDASLEKAWEQNASYSCRGIDTTSAYYVLIIVTIVAIVMRNFFFSLPLWIHLIWQMFNYITVLPLLPIKLGLGTSFYFKHRAFCLTLCLLPRVIMYVYPIAPGMMAFRDNSDKTSGSLADVLYLPTQALINNMLFPVKLEYWGYLRMAVIAICLCLINLGRCRASLNAELVSGSHYQEIVAKIDIFMQRFLPLPGSLGASSLEQTYSTEINDFEACAVTHTIALVLVGVFLASALLYASEEVSRKEFERQIPLGLGVTHGVALNTVLHVLLVPVQTLVAFYAMLFVLRSGAANYLLFVLTTKLDFNF